jgi:hypothetical protein
VRSKIVSSRSQSLVPNEAERQEDNGAGRKWENEDLCPVEWGLSGPKELRCCSDFLQE